MEAQEAADASQASEACPAGSHSTRRPCGSKATTDPGRQATTVLEGVEYSVGRTGVVTLESLDTLIEKQFAKKTKYIPLNKQALRAGYERGRQGLS